MNKKSNKTVAIIQARMGSTRLRGKSLISIDGTPLLLHVVNTTKKLKFLDNILVATTSRDEDDPIKSICESNNIDCFRGDALNLIKRFLDASEFLNENDTIVRITADNPFNWHQISNVLHEHHIFNGNDYTCIDGLSHVVPEFVKVGALRDMNSRFNLSNFDKEHVTPFFRKNPTFFKIKMFEPNFMGLRNDLDRFLTVDIFQDFLRFEKIIKENDILNFKNIYKWLDKSISEKKLNSEDETYVNLFGTRVGKDYPNYVIAEIGQNHNGDINMAKRLIDMAYDCGANAAKFTKRDIQSELTKEAFNKPYDNPNSFGKTYGNHRIFLEFNEEQYKELKEYANMKGITFFSTACDILSVDLLERINCPFYKVASRDLTNIPLLKRLAQTNKPIIISTGMADETDIDDAIEALDLDKDKLIIMQCTSEYPCKPENVNLKGMKTLEEKYGYIVGLSDHTSGVIVSAAAAALGANIIEKHITLDRALKGTDQPGSLEEQGLKKLIQYIRTIELSMGDGLIEFNDDVLSSKEKLARSLTSKVKILKNQILTEDMLCLKSPGDGLLWRDRDNLIGKKAKNEIEKDVTLRNEYFI